MNKILTGLLVMAFAAPALAGEWSAWTEVRKNGEVVVMTSFAGDGATEDAQLDLTVLKAFTVVGVDTIQKDSVCEAFVERNMLRSVPPSGAGTPLSSAQTETCMFVLRPLAKDLGADAVKSLLQVKFAECASSYEDKKPSCVANVKAVR